MQAIGSAQKPSEQQTQPNVSLLGNVPGEQAVHAVVFTALQFVDSMVVTNGVADGTPADAVTFGAVDSMLVGTVPWEVADVTPADSVTADVGPGET